MTCKICNSKTSLLYDKQMKYQYDACQNCGFIYRKEQYQVSINDEKERYLTHDNNINNKGYVKMFNDFLSEGVLPFIQKGKSLDYGCGTQPVLSILLSKLEFQTFNYDVYFDNNTQYLEHKYDLITSTEVFEHFKNPLEDFKKILSLAKENTIISIMTRFIPDDFLSWWYRRDTTHIAFYGVDTFTYLANIYGLEILYTNNINIITFRKG